MSCPELSQKIKHIQQVLISGATNKLSSFFPPRSNFQPCAEQCQQIVLPRFCLCTQMKDATGQRSQRHGMPSPPSQGLQRPLPLREQLLGATAGERERRNFYYYSVKLCCSACQHQINTRAGLKGKANFVRNAGAPLQLGSIEPALNSSFHLLQPSHLPGLITKQWKLPHSVQAFPEA